MPIQVLQQLIMRAAIILLIFFTISCGEDVTLPDNIYYPTQEELDEYGSQLLDLTIWSGNIGLEGLDISDPSYFDSIVEIEGSLILGTWNHKNAFPNLERVNGNDITGDGLFIGTDLDTICFPSLQIVESSFGIANCSNLKVISLPALDSVTGFFRITDNPKLESIIDLNSLTFVSSLTIQRNNNLSSIEGAINLTDIPQKLDIYPYGMEFNGGSFSNLSTVGLGIKLNVTNEESDFSWLSAIENTPSISINGEMNLQSLCVLKDFANQYPTAINIFAHNHGMFDGNWIIDNCP